MKVALYFGSFNPIHTGHLIIAEYVAENADVQQVWLVVSPQNPLKKASGLLNEYDRLHLVNIAVEDNEKLKATDIEFKLPKPSYTIDTLSYLSEKYPMHEFVIVIGSDSYENIAKWKNVQVLKKNYSFIIYERPAFPVDKRALPHGWKLLRAPMLDISSTFIRTQIREGKSIKYLVPDVVSADIQKNGYYKNVL